MSSIAKAFEAAFRRKEEKGWEKIYVVVDIHDTILHACYQNEETYDYMPYARPALQLMSSRDDICLILWSGCYPDLYGLAFCGPASGWRCSGTGTCAFVS